jgi:feruloyl esterase
VVQPPRPAGVPIRAAIVALGLAACHAHGTAPECEGLRALAIAHVDITSARAVGGAAPFCLVDAYAHPVAGSAIHFEVAIPTGAWSGRYVQIGNGGFAGEVPDDEIRAAALRGDAAAGTDDGHASHRAIDASWALGHPVQVVDFGYRAVAETHDAALAIVRASRHEPARFRYFTGCSDGGREALMEAQRYPDAFDGIVAGAPANHATRLLAAFAWFQAQLVEPGAYIAASKLPAIEHAALAACGDAAGVIEDPRACHFDPAVLRCTGAEDDRCLTGAQVAALAKLYAGPGWYPGLEPGGEAEAGGWADWITGSGPGEPGRAVDLRFAATYFRYMVFGDPHLDLRGLDFERDIAATEAKLGPILDASSPDLAAFAHHGGKLIQWHGWNDQAIPPRDSIAYYDQVSAKLGDPSAFYRLFLVPGMLHCEGGRGPREVPALDALENWVEHGRAPDRMIAPGTTRPATWTLCPYPSTRC